MNQVIKQLFTLGAFVFSFNVASAQITFQKTFGWSASDGGYAVQQTIDGGYILSGYAGVNGTGNSNAYLIKTNAAGDSIWTKSFGDVLEDYGYSVQQTTDSGFIIAGFSRNFVSNNFDIYLIKTNTNGDTLWTKSYGGANNDYVYSVRQTFDNGYIMVGATGITGNSDVYLIKSDANGNLLWAKTFGNVNQEYGYSIEQTNDGGFIITGAISSFGGGYHNVYVVKTDSSGNLLWAKAFGGANTDIGKSVKQTIDGGYIISGYTASFGAGSVDVYLLKTDSMGNELWSKSFGGTGIEDANSVLQTTDGGYIILGNTNSFGAGSDDVYLIKTNSSGDTLWTKVFGGIVNDKGYSIQQTNDGGYIITGHTSSFGAGSFDVYLIKTDSFGNSGCNEGSTTTILTTPVTIETSPATIVTLPTTVVLSSTTIVGSGGIVTALCTTVGINEIALDNSFIISPNPSTNNFTISFERRIIKGNVEILNILGENVFAENILNESKKEINLKNISDGIYFVKVFDDEKYYCKKIIIEQN